MMSNKSPTIRLTSSTIINLSYTTTTTTTTNQHDGPFYRCTRRNYRFMRVRGWMVVVALPPNELSQLPRNYNDNANNFYGIQFSGR